MKKMEEKIVQLEGKLKQEREANKIWKTKIEKLEVDLIVVGEDPKDSHPIKKLLDDKEKTIQALKKKLKIPRTEHVQIEELVTLQ